MDIEVKQIVDLDAGTRRIRKLHPTLKKCRCGFIGTKHVFMGHMDTLLAARRAGGEKPEIFWSQHGEVPLNEDEA